MKQILKISFGLLDSLHNCLMHCTAVQDCRLELQHLVEDSQLTSVLDGWERGINGLQRVSMACHRCCGRGQTGTDSVEAQRKVFWLQPIGIYIHCIYTFASNAISTICTSTTYGDANSFCKLPVNLALTWYASFEKQEVDYVYTRASQIFKEKQS